MLGPIALPQVESVSHHSENVPMLICSPLLTWQRLLFAVLPLLPLHFLFHPLPVISFPFLSSPSLMLSSSLLFFSSPSFLSDLSSSSLSSPFPHPSVLSLSISPLFLSSVLPLLFPVSSPPFPLSPSLRPLLPSLSIFISSPSFLSFLPLPHTLPSAVLFFSPFLFFCSSSPFFSVLSSPPSLFLPL